MAYRKVRLKLDVVLSEPTEIVPISRVVNEVFILVVPAGVTIQLQFGQSGDPIDISSPIAFQPTGSDAVQGVYWRNPVASPGVTVDIYVATTTDTQGVARMLPAPMITAPEPPQNH